MQLGIILLIIFSGMWVISLFLGYIGGMSKNFSKVPTVTDSSAIKDQEQKSIDDTKEKQRALMQEIKDKMRDSSH